MPLNRVGRKILDPFFKKIDLYLSKDYDSEAKNTIQLKDGWDIGSKYDDECDAFYVGRQDEVDRLSEWLKRDQGGSVLISGVRGVGKTSYVYESIRKSYENAQIAKLRNHSRNKNRGRFFSYFDWILLMIKRLWFAIREMFCRPMIWRTVVLLDYSTVSLWVKNNDRLPSPNDKLLDTSYKSEIIKSLIVSLHNSEIKDKRIKRRIGYLYDFVKYKSNKEDSYGWNFGFLVQIPVAVLVCLLIYLFFQQYLPLALSVKLFPIVDIMIGYLGATFIYKSWVKVAYKKIANSRSFSYKYSELLDLLKESTKEKFIFVIDELDKADPNDLKKVIAEFFNLFKNFILLSGSKFIFITSQKYYKDSIVEKEEFSVESTYFSWKVFLSTSIGSHFVEFIKHYAIGSEKLDLICQEVGYCLFYESRGVFKIAKELLIEDFVRGNSITIGDDEIRRKARLGKIVDILFCKNPINKLSESIYKFEELELMFQVIYKIRDAKGWVGNLEDVIKSVDSLTDKNRLRYLGIIIDLLKMIKDKSIEGGMKKNTPIIPDINNPDLSINFKLEDDDISTNVVGLNWKGRWSSHLEVSLGNKVVEVSKIVNEYHLNNKIYEIKYIFKEGDDRLYEEIVSFSKMTNELNCNDEVIDIDQEKVANYLNEISRINEYLKGKFDVYCYTVYRMFREYCDDLLLDQIENGYIYKRNNMLLKVNNISKSSTVLINGVKFGSLKYLENNFLSFYNLLGEKLEIGENKIHRFPKIVFNRESVKYVSNWEYSSKQFLLLGKGSSSAVLKQLSMEIKTESLYWRFGVGFGVSEKEVEPLDGHEYTLIHLYKNEDDNSIRLKVYVDKETIDKYPGQELNVDVLVSNYISAIYKLYMSYDENNEDLTIEVNGKEVTKIKLIKNKIDKFVLLGWGDRKEYQIEVTKLNYIYDEVA